MNFYFVQDTGQKFRFFSSEHRPPIQIEFSRLRKFWELAKTKLMLLPFKVLKQEQAFEHILKIEEDSLEITVSGLLEEKKMDHKFYFYLQRQRTKHILLMIFEVLILPVCGIAALLPGPNVFFYVPALLIVIQWKALRGMNRLLKKDVRFLHDPDLKSWEIAVQTRDKDRFQGILEAIEHKHGLHDLAKILLKKRRDS